MKPQDTHTDPPAMPWFDRRDRTFLIALAACSLLAFAVTCWTMRFGPGITPDSVFYTQNARSLLAGEGFAKDGVPETHWPPVYPALLAVAMYVPDDPAPAGRVLHAFFYAINFALVAAMTYLLAGRSWWAAGATAGLFASSQIVLDGHLNLLSEAPFVTFVLLTVWCLSRTVAQRDMRLLVAAGLCTALAAMARYAGIALVPPMLISLLVLRRDAMRQRLIDAAVYCAAAGVPIVLWVLRNQLVGDGATDRALTLHLVGGDHIHRLTMALYNFWLPIPIRPWLAGLQLVAGVAAIAMGLRAALRQQRGSGATTWSQPNAFAVVGILFGLLYVTFLLTSISLFDAHTPLDGRILMPAYIVFIVAAITLVWSVTEATPARKSLRACAVAAAFVLACVNGDRALALIDIHRTDGVGYASEIWRKNGALAFVKNVPVEVAVVTNGRDVVIHQTGRPAQKLPQRFSPVSREENANFDAEIQELCDQVAAGGVVIVWFDAFESRRAFPTRDELEAALTARVPDVRRIPLPGATGYLRVPGGGQPVPSNNVQN